MPAIISTLVRWLCVIPALLLAVCSGKEYLVRRKATAADKLAGAGFKRRALFHYDELEASQVKDGRVLLDHAKLLYQSGMLSRASDVIEKAKSDFISNEVFLFAARVYSEIGNFPAAEEYYKTALYMVPNRMGSRYELMKLYLQRGDSVRARYWAYSIVQMAVKVKSKKAEMIKDQAMLINNNCRK